MRAGIFQKGFNYSQDGPGNRLVYHLQGCDMCCPWCANPDGVNCGASCREIEVEEILREIVSCRALFFDGGGVTFTGGEPTLQFEALAWLLRTLKAKNIHTVIETNGCSNRLKDLLEAIDLVIIDFKHYDPARYAEIGGDGLLVQANLARIFERRAACIVRTPLVNYFNAQPGDAERFAAFYSRHDTANARFELLPYHEYGKIKWERLGMAYTVNDGYVDAETLREFADVYTKHGLNLIST